jgi:hypothetical protein
VDCRQKSKMNKILSALEVQIHNNALYSLTIAWIILWFLHYNFHIPWDFMRNADSRALPRT